MREWHGIIADASMRDKSVIRKMHILGEKKGWIWTLYKVEVEAKNIENVIKLLQKNLLDGFYFHFYKDDELIVAFKDKVFRIRPTKSTWKEAIEYGMTTGISKEQLVFSPCRTQDEEF